MKIHSRPRATKHFGKVLIIAAAVIGTAAKAENSKLEEGKALVREICGTDTSATVVTGRLQADGGMSFRKQGVQASGAVSLSHKDLKGLASMVAANANASTDSLSKAQIDCWRSQSAQLWNALNGNETIRKIAKKQDVPRSKPRLVLRNPHANEAANTPAHRIPPTPNIFGSVVAGDQMSNTSLNIMQQNGSIISYNSFSGFDRVRIASSGSTVFQQNEVTSSYAPAPIVKVSRAEMVVRESVVRQLLAEWVKTHPEDEYKSKRAQLDNAGSFINKKLIDRGEKWSLDSELEARVGQ